MSNRITKDTLIGELLEKHMETAPILLGIGMHCLGCPSSRGESIEEAAMVHGIDIEVLLKLINDKIMEASA
ncbi:MAG: DUF1858 domain-containing protein [Firmicutes bacterium]|nr:DUF1858 domain-containing protein [Bacillota bacterium]